MIADIGHGRQFDQFLTRPLSPLVGFAFALLMSRIWHAGLEWYQSAGG